MRQLRIRHRTAYRYPDPVEFHPHRMYVRPREGHDIRIQSSTLVISPANQVVWHRDVHGNSVATAEFREPGTELSILSEVGIEHYAEVPVEFTLDPHGLTYPFHYQAHERIDLAPYQFPLFATGGEAVEAWAAEFWTPGRSVPTSDLLVTVNRAIAERFTYTRRETPGVQRPAETLELGSGSCRDLATLFLETCRHFGLAARFVSGYLHAPRLPAAEGATHAWTEVYLPGAGWRGVDSTTGDLAGPDHIAVAVSRHPEGVPPVAGAFSGRLSGPPTMEVDVQVGLV